MKKYRLKQCDMNVDELKIKALLEGLEAQNIEEFMRQAKVGDYRNYGKAYISAFRGKIEEEKPLFITDDGVQVTDGYMGMILVCRDFSKSFRYAKDCRVDIVEASTKIFAHESNADGYIWRNKPLLSVKDVVDNCENLSYAENIELIKLAKERRKK